MDAALHHRLRAFAPLRWIFATIRRKAIFVLLVILLIIVLLTGANVTDWARGFIFDGLTRQAVSVSRFVSLDIQAALERGGGRSEVMRLMEVICGDPAVVYARLVEPSGRDFATSCLRTGAEVLHPLSLAQMDEIVPGGVRVMPYGALLDVYRAFPARDATGKEGKWFLLMGFDATETQSVAARVARVIALSSLSAFLLGLLVLTAAVNRMTRPIESLTRAIAEVGKGAYPGPLPVRGIDEMATVTEAFNRMVGDLTRSSRDLEEYQSHLEDKVAERTGDLARANDILSHTNRSLEAANEKLRELDRLKSNFLGIATHELKTPVTVVGGYLEYLETGVVGDLTDLQREVVKAAHLSCERMTALISDMLDLARIESGKLPIDPVSRPLRGTVDRAIAHLAPLIARKRLDIRLAGGLEESALFDRDRLEQVLVNLVGNAVKFTPAGGRITVTARMKVEGKRNYLLISVADTGIGISREDLPRVFDEFAQVGPPEKEEGTGLGLAICRRIVTAHGGTIGVESEPGKGSTFFFTLPI
jgi:signal transduction histidine kinase